MKRTRAFFCLVAVVLSLAAPNVNAQYVCQRAPDPIQITGSITAGDVVQAGRITRAGNTSSCTGGGGTLQNGVAVRRDVYNFTNPFSETVCVRLEQDFTGCADNSTMSVAYSIYNPAFPAVNVIGNPGFSTIGKGSYSFSVGPNANFAVVVHEVDPNTGCPQYQLKISYLRNCRQAGFDRTNDGKADPTVYHVSNSSFWTSFDSATNQLVSRSFGTVGDLVTGGSDYTGDGQTDLSVYRPSTNTWIHGRDQDSPDTIFRSVQFGLAGDRAVPGDYDGDGINDIALWRPSEGNYYLLRSSDGAFVAFHWGQTNDIPVFGDFDGDTITDYAVVRPVSGGSTWYIQKSNYRQAFDVAQTWGLPTDRLMPGDYDGDAITDVAVWRPSTGTFYVLRSSDQSLLGFQWGLPTDLPQPADYDGDGKMDFAVYRQSNNAWYILNSGTNSFRALTLGVANDIPITTAYRVL